jgi:WD40 repeat protein
VNCILEILDDIIVSCSEDKTIKVWNLNSGECLKTIAAHSEAVFYMDKISKSKIISSSAEKFIKVWDIETGDCLQSLEVQENCVWSMEIFR